MNTLCVLFAIYSSVLGEAADNASIQLYLTTYRYDRVPLEMGNYSMIDYDNETLFYIHGLNQNSSETEITELTREYLKKGGYNIIAVDWGKMSKTINYFAAAASTRTVGEYVGGIIVDMKQDLKKITIVGFSLGAEVAGFSGKYVLNATGQRIKCIFGLDPAGPLFGYFKCKPPSERLDAEDARMVNVLHTSILHYGTACEMGRFNFYANSGSLQPNCWWRLPGICSHGRALTLHIESINSDGFKAYRMNGNTFNPKNLNYSDVQIYGRDIPDGQKKLYYFETNGSPPYARN